MYILLDCDFSNAGVNLDPLTLWSLNLGASFPTIYELKLCCGVHAKTAALLSLVLRFGENYLSTRSQLFYFFLILDFSDTIPETQKLVCSILKCKTVARCSLGPTR